MEQHDEIQGEDYPHGRGYGNDYMRGGEVFGGYGYSDREEYERPRGELKNEVGARDGERAERFPQDERAGGWEVPHDLSEESDVS